MQTKLRKILTLEEKIRDEILELEIQILTTKLVTTTKPVVTNLVVKIWISSSSIFFRILSSIVSGFLNVVSIFFTFRKDPAV